MLYNVWGGAFAGLSRKLWDNVCFCAIGAVALCVFFYYAHAITCLLQNVFLGWADINRTCNLFVRFLSISLMMVVRLLVSNVLPFTSPAFAFLIAKSQPPDSEWAGTFYLIACSMPAGAVVPLSDYFFFKV